MSDRQWLRSGFPVVPSSWTRYRLSTLDDSSMTLRGGQGKQPCGVGLLPACPAACLGAPLRICEGVGRTRKRLRARVLRLRRRDSRREQRQACLEVAARRKQRLKEKNRRLRRAQLASPGRKEDKRRRSRLLRGHGVSGDVHNKLGRSHGRGARETACDLKPLSRGCLAASSLQRCVMHVAAPRSAWKRAPSSCRVVAYQRRPVCLRRHHVFVPERYVQQFAASLRKKGERRHDEKMAAACSVGSTTLQRDTPESSEEPTACADGACASFDDGVGSSKRDPPESFQESTKCSDAACASCDDGVDCSKTCEAPEAETCALGGSVFLEHCSFKCQSSLQGTSFAAAGEADMNTDQGDSFCACEGGSARQVFAPGRWRVASSLSGSDIGKEVSVQVIPRHIAGWRGMMLLDGDLCLVSYEQGEHVSDLRGQDVTGALKDTVCVKQLRFALPCGCIARPRSSDVSCDCVPFSRKTVSGRPGAVFTTLSDGAFPDTLLGSGKRVDKARSSEIVVSGKLSDAFVENATATRRLLDKYGRNADTEEE